MDIWLFCRLAFAILGIIIPGVLAILEYRKTHNMRSWKFILLGFASFLFLVFGIITTLEGFYGPKEDKDEIITTTKDTGDKVIDKVVTTAEEIKNRGDSGLEKTDTSLQKISKEIKSGFDELDKNANAYKTKEFASLYVCETDDGKNPKIFHTNNPDSMLLAFTICNNGNIAAVNLRDKAVFLIRRGENFILPSKNYHVGAGKYQNIQPNIGTVLEMPVFFRETNDDFFACLKINYRYNNRKDSIIEIIKLNKNLINGGMAFRANFDDSEKIEKFLVQKGIW